MIDQATQLRNLVLQSTHEAVADHVPAPRLLVVSGGRSGVGVTTLAANLAVALSEHGVRVVLVDADLYRADVAVRFGMHQQSSVADVLAARLDIHDVLQQGPCGIQVVPGVQGPATSAEYSVTAQRRLLRQLRSLGRHADIVLLDAGNSSSEVMRRFWQAADEVLLVTTPESVAVMDCYATLKRLAIDAAKFSIRLIVNKTADRTTAEDVHRRINTSCQRFLGLGVGLLGHVPAHTCFATVPEAGTSIVGSTLSDAKTQALGPVVARLMARISRSADSTDYATQPQDNANKANDSAQPRSVLSPIVN